MRLTLLMTALLALSSPLAFADGAKCSCTTKCHKACKMGHAKNCKCTHCGCAKSADKCDMGCGHAAAAPASQN